MTGYTYLYKTASVVDITYSRYSVFFDIHQEDKKPKAWIFIKKFRDVNDDNITKVIEASFQKMTEEEISKSKGLRIKVIRFREGMSYKQLADNSPLGRHAEGKLRLLNGHYPNGIPRIGNLIKIVE
jgi:predicted Zn-dependent protease